MPHTLSLSCVSPPPLLLRGLVSGQYFLGRGVGKILGRQNQNISWSRGARLSLPLDLRVSLTWRAARAPPRALRDTLLVRACTKRGVVWGDEGHSVSSGGSFIEREFFGFVFMYFFLIARHGRSKARTCTLGRTVAMETQAEAILFDV